MSGEVLHRVARADQLHERADISFLCGINRACALSSATLRCSLYGILRSALNGEEEHRHINYDQGKNRLHETASAGETLCGFPTLVIVNKRGWRERASKDSSVGSFNCPSLAVLSCRLKVYSAGYACVFALAVGEASVTMRRDGTNRNSYRAKSG